MLDERPAMRIERRAFLQKRSGRRHADDLAQFLLARDDMLEGVHLSSVTVNLIFSSPHIAPSPSPSLFARQSGFPEIPRALVVLHGFRGFFRIHVGDLVSGELHRLELQPRIQIEVVRLTHDEVQ